MKKAYFRSPFLFLFTLAVLLGCNRAQKETRPEDSAEIQKGWDLEQRAFQFLAQDRADSAFSYFSRSRNHYEKARDSTRVVYSLLNIGAIQYQYNDFSEMQGTMVEALKFLNQSGQYYKPIIYNNLGIAYCQLEDYPRAIENYERTLSFANSPVHQLTAKNNIGYVYISSGDYQKAFHILTRVYASPAIGDSLSLKARVMDNLGYCAYKLGRLEAIPLIDQGLAIRGQLGDYFGQITSNLHLGEALLDRNKAKAMAAGRQAEYLATKTNSPDDRLLALDFLIRNSEPNAVREYSLLFLRISDSLQTARRKARNHFAEVKYNYKLEREQKLQLQANQARVELRESELENERLSWLLAALCIAIIAATAIYIIVRRNKRMRWKASYEAEVRIANRLHDELANDLHQTIVFTEANDFSESASKDRLLDNLDLIYRRARAISRENASVGNDDFSAKLKDLISFYGSPGQSVLAKGIGEISWAGLTEQQRVAVHRSVQELLVNMKKHSQCTLAFLQFDCEGQRLKIAYSDNGVGSQGFTAPKHGLSIMENRIGSVNGTAIFGHGGKGFRVNIEFPL